MKQWEKKEEQLLNQGLTTTITKQYQHELQQQQWYQHLATTAPILLLENSQMDKNTNW